MTAHLCLICHKVGDAFLGKKHFFELALIFCCEKEKERLESGSFLVLLNHFEGDEKVDQTIKQFVCLHKGFLNVHGRLH